MKEESFDVLNEDLWVFGYGSLIWRPDLEHTETREGFIRGWKRRFWQGSTDHRGVPEAPGRVVTLVPVEHAERFAQYETEEEEWKTFGVAYRVPNESKVRVLAELDYREKGGYERHNVKVYGCDNEEQVIVPKALIYIASEDNPNWLGGQAGLDAIAKQIATSVGPSGPNTQYLFELAEAMKSRGMNDHHLNELVTRVNKYLAS